MDRTRSTTTCARGRGTSRPSGCRHNSKHVSRCILTPEASMKYKIALQQTEEGFSVSVPGLPGCWSQGATEEEAIANIHDAIRDYLAAREDLLRGATVREIEVAG